MRREVQHELIRRFRSLASARTTQLAAEPCVLPASEYSSRDQLQTERSVLLRGGTLVAALSGDIPNPGDAVAAHLDGVPVAVVRDDDGRVRVYRNACPHRGAPVVSDRQQGLRRLTCPFHAWTFGLGGELQARPLAAGCFDGADVGCDLSELSADERHGFVLARLDGGPVDAPDYLGGVVDDLDSFELASARHVETRSVVLPCNWKMVIDTFLEAYHVFSLHKNTIAPLYYSHPMLFDAFGPHCRLIGLRRTLDDIGEDESTWDFPPHATIHYVVFPNTIVVHQLDHFELWRVYPNGDDPSTSLVHTGVYAHDLSDGAVRRWKKNLDILLEVTTQEDFPVCGEMQRALDSGATDRVVFGRNELALTHFHEQVRGRLGLAPR